MSTAAPDTITPADLADARRYATGAIWRQPLTNDELVSLYCAPEGGEHREPAPTTDDRKPWIGVALVALPWVLGVVGWAAMARMG